VAQKKRPCMLITASVLTTNKTCIIADLLHNILACS